MQLGFHFGNTVGLLRGEIGRFFRIFGNIVKQYRRSVSCLGIFLVAPFGVQMKFVGPREQRGVAALILAMRQKGMALLRSVI